MINLQLLGTIQIKKGDGSPDQSIPKGSKRVALLAYLVLHKPEKYHRRDTLIALFWPDLGQKSARNSLSNILYHIREALGKDIIVNRGTEEIRINHEKIKCDVHSFLNALEKNKLYEAHSQYSGDLLSGFHIDHVSNDFQDWMDAERQRLRDSYCTLCWSLASMEAKKNNPESAFQFAMRAKKLKPYSEENIRRAIQFLADHGKLNDALQVYAEFAKRMKSELDAEPSADLTSYVNKLSNKLLSEQSPDKTKERHPEKVVSELAGNHLDNYSEPADKEPDQEKFNYDYKFKSFFTGAVVLLLLAAAVIYTINTAGTQESTILPKDKSVAVLPFTYINSPDSTDYFSLGITEEILSKLARIADLSVTSRTSVMQYRNTDKSIREIASELGVSSVVEGSVQRHWDDVRITAQLIDAETDEHLWGDTYDRKVENILDIQSEVAARIADALKAELISAENSDHLPGRDVNDYAYQIYLQAKHLLNIHKPDGVMESVELFEESISIDPTFAPAHGGLSLAYYYAGLLSTLEFRVTGVEGINLQQAAELSLESASKALEINPNIVEANLAQAIIYQRIYSDWIQSEDKFLKALSLNPNNSDVRREYGFHLLFQGKLDEAIHHMEKAVDVDPLSWYAHHGLGYAYYCARRHDEAILELETSIRLGSHSPITNKHLSLALLKKSQQLFNDGRNEEAIALIDRGSGILDEVWGSNTGWKETVVYAAMGDTEKTLKSIKENSLPKAPTLYSLLLIGQTNDALQFLNERLNFRINRTFIDPIFDSVRHDPRFMEMVRRDLNKDVVIE